MAVRALAVLTASAVSDDARQDEDHAGDTDHVRDVLRAEPGVHVLARRAEVQDHVERAAGCHHGEADEHQERELTDVAQEDLYRKHALEIHPLAAPVNCIARIGV
jgi:hypothetical protein